MHQLRPHQQKIVNEAPDKYGLFLKMRVGKTATAIRLASTRAVSALVIVPKSLKEQWEEEIIKWNNMPDGMPSSTEFYVITKETFRRDWEKLPRHEAVIIDEAHLGFANFKSQLYKAGRGFIDKHSPRCIWLLSGTPYTSSAWSIFSLGNLLGKKWSWYSWKSKFFYDIKMGHRLIPVQKKGIEEEISKIINMIGCTLSLSDISEQAEDEYIFEYFDLNPKQKELINNYFDPIPVVRFGAQHQIESGVKLSNGYEDNIVIDCDKTKRLLEICEENNKIVIIARYNLQLETYKKLLEKNGRKCFLINGDTKDKLSVCKLMADSNNCVALVNAACNFGLDFHTFDIMVFASMSYSFVDHEQIKNRIKNMDKNRSCTYLYLLTRNCDKIKSVDIGIINSVKQKKDFDETIFSKKHE